VLQWQLQSRARLPEETTMNHQIDGNAIAADAHYDQPDPMGHEGGETCNRVHEPDEDAPRGYRPKQCSGVMYLDCTYGDHYCDTCGEIGD